MTRWLEVNKKFFRNRQFLISLGSSLVLLAVSIFINYYAAGYALKSISNPVTDIILSNTRVYDVDAIFVSGAIIFWVFIIALCLWQPHKVPFILKSVALFIVIRSLFVILTHIAPFPTRVIINPGSIISDFTFGGDLFFSGHTGLPFLMALIFWNDKWLRVFFIIVALIFGVVVLLGHIHYSIDVFGAFFITYSIFHIAEVFFKKDQELFNLDIPTT